METSIFVITTNNTGSMHQLWFYNYLARITGNSIESVTVGENYSICEKKELEYYEGADLKKLLINIVPECNRVSAERVALTKMTLDCGERYRNIYRPLYTSFFTDIYDVNPLQNISPDHYVDPTIENLQDYNNYIRQLELILDELIDIFKVVSPHSRNMKVFGNAIRNVLILSCTEVDSLMKSVLNGNGYKVGRPNMNDYRQLIIPMKLFDYTLAFRYINEVGGKTPFGKWDPKENSNSPSWYKAYNDVKHDRINNFKEANLRNAIEATLGFATMLIAIYGYRNDIWNEKIGKIINVRKEPFWMLKDLYLPPIQDSIVKYVNHPNICKRKH